MEKEEEIRIQIDRFDGPLALLLHLIQKDDYQIKDLELTKITKQYLAYLDKMNELDFDIAGEFLYMASTLLQLKSQYCVDEEDHKLQFKMGDDEAPIQTQADLISRLEELERFQKLGSHIWELPKLGEDTFTRPRFNRKKIVDSMTAPMELGKLTESMIDYLIKNHRQYKVVKRDRISIKEKLKTLASMLKVGETYSFSNLIELENGVDDIVITFISLLELARLKKVSIFQVAADELSRGEINVEVLEQLTDVDIEVANGFDEEEVAAAVVEEQVH